MKPFDLRSIAPESALDGKFLSAVDLALSLDKVDGDGAIFIKKNIQFLHDLIFSRNAPETVEQRLFFISHLGLRKPRYHWEVSWDRMFGAVEGAPECGFIISEGGEVYEELYMEGPGGIEAFHIDSIDEEWLHERLKEAGLRDPRESFRSAFEIFRYIKFNLHKLQSDYIFDAHNRDLNWDWFDGMIVYRKLYDLGENLRKHLYEYDRLNAAVFIYLFALDRKYQINEEAFYLSQKHLTNVFLENDNKLSVKQWDSLRYKKLRLENERERIYSSNVADPSVIDWIITRGFFVVEYLMGASAQFILAFIWDQWDRDDEEEIRMYQENLEDY